MFTDGTNRLARHRGQLSCERKIYISFSRSKFLSAQCFSTALFSCFCFSLPVSVCRSLFPNRMAARELSGRVVYRLLTAIHCLVQTAMKLYVNKCTQHATRREPVDLASHRVYHKPLAKTTTTAISSCWPEQPPLLFLCKGHLQGLLLRHFKAIKLLARQGRLAKLKRERRGRRKRKCEYIH